MDVVLMSSEEIDQEISEYMDLRSRAHRSWKDLGDPRLYRVYEGCNKRLALLWQAKNRRESAARRIQRTVKPEAVNHDPKRLASMRRKAERSAKASEDHREKRKGSTNGGKPSVVSNPVKAAKRQRKLDQRK